MSARPERADEAALREAAALRQRAYRARQKAAQVVNITDLPAFCWCEAEIVHVPRETILGLRTESCGRPGCEEPT